MQISCEVLQYCKYHANICTNTSKASVCTISGSGYDDDTSIDAGQWQQAPAWPLWPPVLLHNSESDLRLGLGALASGSLAATTSAASQARPQDCSYANRFKVATYCIQFYALANCTPTSLCYIGTIIGDLVKYCSEFCF